MAREKEKTVEVTLGEGDKAKKVKITVKRPGSIVNNRANAIYNQWLHSYMRDGIMTKVELDKFMEERGIWSPEQKQKEKTLAEEIRGLTKDLFQGVRGRRKASEGKKIAVEIKKKRSELQQLIGEKISLEQNTAESLADNMKFDFLVSECTYDANGKKVYKDLEDYSDRADDEIAFIAAATLAQMMYSLDPNFEAELPENQFLQKFDYVDSNFNLLDDQGHTVSLDGKMIDELGYYINEKGEKVDSEGNLVDDRGNFVMFTEYTEDTPKKQSSKSNGKKKEEDSV